MISSTVVGGIEHPLQTLQLIIEGKSYRYQTIQNIVCFSMMYTKCVKGLSIQGEAKLLGKILMGGNTHRDKQY